MDPIGIRETQSLLRTVTQRSLSYFHTAGMSGGISNRQRPSIADGMESRYTSENTSMIFKTSLSDGALKRALVGRDMRWFVQMMRGSFIELPDAENLWYDVLGEDMYSDNTDEIILRFYVDYKRLLEYDFTLRELASSCFRDAHVSVSPDFMGMIDLRVDDGYVLRWLEQMGNRVCGTSDILDVSVACHNQSKIYHAISRGANMLAVSRVKGIDKTTIESNHVLDVQRNLGIEAAASVLNRVIQNNIISDFMTRTGTVLPFSKYSIEMRRKGVMTSAGLERPRDDIRAALQSNKWDEHPSIYADIMVGKSPVYDKYLFLI